MKIKDLASIIIVNYNNAKFLKNCLKSVLNQSYKNLEIIIVDDNSTDNSKEIIKNLNFRSKKIFIKKKTNYGSFNQINAYKNGFKVSRGDFIFFLDSDDFFKKNKITNVINYFKKNSKIKICFDLPIIYKNGKTTKKKFKQKYFLFSSWPRFSPQSCIAVKREYADEIFKVSSIKKYTMLWFDFRIATYSFLKFKKLNIIRNYLTYYRQLPNSASKEYNKFSRIWWERRSQAHDYFTYISSKLKLHDRFTIDKLITKLIKIFLN